MLQKRLDLYLTYNLTLDLLSLLGRKAIYLASLHYLQGTDETCFAMAE
jgi:hypothetical protein